MKKKHLVWITATVGLIIILAIVLIPYISSIIQFFVSPNLLSTLNKFIEDAGSYGVLALILVHLVQVVIAILPGEPIEILFGAMLGPIYGTIFCLIGLVLANSIIFSIVRHLGKAWLERQNFYKKIENTPYLTNTSNLKKTIFIVYLIPGTPKDLLVYACALTKIDLQSFLIISTIARIPSVLTSTLIGSNLLDGNFSATAITFIVTVIFGAAGLIFHEIKYGKKIREKKKPIPSKTYPK